VQVARIAETNIVAESTPPTAAMPRLNIPIDLLKIPFFIADALI
jgi:hypothetical protein